MSLIALPGIPEAAEVRLERIDLLDWGATVILSGTAGAQPFSLRYDDCRDHHWRVYVHERAESAALVSFAPGRDHGNRRLHA